jgi:hypothetical protein
VLQDYKASGAALEEPTQVSSSDGTLSTTLTLDQFRYEGPTTQMWTRAFNGALPGPTLRVRCVPFLQFRAHKQDRCCALPLLRHTCRASFALPVQSVAWESLYCSCFVAF